MNEQPDGTLFSKFSGDVLILVTKKEGQLRLTTLDFDHLQFNLAQSLMMLEEPYRLVSAYLQTAVLGLLWQNPPRHVGMVGLGGGRLARVLHHHFPDVQIEAVEIEPVMVQVAQEFFGLPQDERITVVLGDGRSYLTTRLPANYDWLFVDAFSAKGETPYHLVTQEFYTLCSQHLAPGGVLIVNVLNGESLYWERMHTLQTVFENIYFCRLTEGNTILFASQVALPNIVEVVKQTAVLQQVYEFSFPLTDRACLIQAVPEMENGRVLQDQPQITTDDTDEHR